MDINLVVISSLFLTSMLVRVLPSLVEIQFSKNTKYLVEEVFPASIFISFITYIVMSEALNALSASFVSFITVFVLTIVLRCGLVLTTIIASALYYALV